jgi:NDP-sugar pyrophosphorylase family protein
MKAMIMAAGLGTRLKPFTENHPKALYIYEGKTLLQHALEHLEKYGIKDIIVNVHHFASQIIEYIELNNNFGLNISFSDESDALLETGGGLLKARWFFGKDDDFVLRNVDIISDLNLWEMTSCHQKNRALATLAMRTRQTSRYLLFDQENRLAGWENLKTGEQILCGSAGRDGTDDQEIEITKRLAFSGIHVINAQIFELIREKGKFSMTDLYLRLARTRKILGFEEQGSLWLDVGSSTSCRTE